MAYCSMFVSYVLPCFLPQTKLSKGGLKRPKPLCSQMIENKKRIQTKNREKPWFSENKTVGFLVSSLEFFSMKSISQACIVGLVELKSDGKEEKCPGGKKEVHCVVAEGICFFVSRLLFKVLVKCRLRG